MVGLYNTVPSELYYISIATYNLTYYMRGLDSELYYISIATITTCQLMKQQAALNCTILVSRRLSTQV